LCEAIALRTTRDKLTGFENWSNCMPIDASTVRSLLRYDESTGEFFWLHRRNRQLAGAKAGGMKSTGHIDIAIFRKRYFAHRLAWLYVYGAWPTKPLDHINGNPADNRICNLRELEVWQNNQNRHRVSRSKSGSKLLGTSYCKREQKWRASIGIDGRKLSLGYFHSEEEAHAAYLEGKRKHHPFSTL